MIFRKDDVVKIRHGARDRFVQVESGPFKMFTNDHRDYYQGWLLLGYGDVYGEPATVCFAETEAVIATDFEVLSQTQGKLDLREASF